MSNTPKVPLRLAIENAEAFQALFLGTAVQWEVAGSIRRERREVGDVEHVVISKMLDAQPDDALFGDALPPVDRINAVWARMDLLIEQGTLERAIYSDGKTRYGPKYRGVVFKGIRHEIFSANDSNFGAILAIRTGPAEFSQQLVTRLRDAGRYRMNEGQVQYAGGKNDGVARPVAGERDFFALCGVPWIEPKLRDTMGMRA